MNLPRRFKARIWLCHGVHLAITHGRCHIVPSDVFAAKPTKHFLSFFLFFKHQLPFSHMHMDFIQEYSFHLIYSHLCLMFVVTVMFSLELTRRICFFNTKWILKVSKTSCKGKWKTFIISKRKYFTTYINILYSLCSYGFFSILYTVSVRPLFKH